MVKLSSSEEENTEFLSSLWNRYKYLFIVGFSSIIVGIVGWDSWTESIDKNQQQASDSYENFLEIIRNTETDPTILAKEIIENYPNSLYADLVTLYLAKLQVEKSDFIEAEKHLRWVLKKHSSFWRRDFDPIEVTARHRLARILVADNRPKEAFDLINDAKYLDNILYEIKGDAEYHMGLLSDSRLSYLKAIESTQSPSIQAMLKMKLADLEAEN